MWLFTVGPQDWTLFVKEEKGCKSKVLTKQLMRVYVVGDENASTFLYYFWLYFYFYFLSMRALLLAVKPHDMTLT